MSIVFGRTPPVRRELSEAERKDREDLIVQLKERRAQLELQLQQSNSVPHNMRKNIFATIRAGHVTQLQLLLKQQVYVTDERDYNNCTPLHIAAYEGRGDMVSVLLEYGADPAVVDNQGRTPRDIALANRHISVGRLLFNAQMRMSSLFGSADLSGVGANGSMDTPTNRPQIAGAFPPDDSSLLLAPDGTDWNSGWGPDGQPHEAPGASAGEEGDWPPTMGSSRFCTIADSMSVVVCMVGLPGRGKSFISKRIARYLNWKGVPCQVFNAGNYRRQLLGVEQTATSEFFDPCNPEAVRLREEMARLACDDLRAFLDHHGVAVGVLDATNTTLERRQSLIHTFTAPGALNKRCRVIFIESVCTDESIILENILRAKCGNDDFKHVADSATVIKEFRERIHQYEKVYETLTLEENASFIKIKNVKDQILLHNISGGVPTRLAYFLLNLHPVAYPIYLALPGETTGLLQRRFVGDQTLTFGGARFANDLLAFVEERCEDGNKITLLHSTDPCVERTVEPLECLSAGKLDVIPMRCLDDINAGTFSGLTHSEAQRYHPKMFSRLFPACEEGADSSLGPPQNYTVAFPKGESSRQVNVRLETALLQIMRIDGPVLVVAPLVPLQGVLAFLTDILPELSPTIDIPGHCVIEIGIKGTRIVHELHGRSSHET